MKAEVLYSKALDSNSALSSFSKNELDDFRLARNRFAHYGFIPRDDQESAVLLLRTGLPFLRTCYQEFFAFDLQDGLDVDIARQLAVALDTFKKVRTRLDLDLSYCFSALAHLIRMTEREGMAASWQVRVLRQAEEVGVKFDHCERRKAQIERALKVSWFIDCPICREIGTFVCELDESRMQDGVLVLTRGACASCDWVTPNPCPLLLDALCAKQITEGGGDILRGFGITHLEK